MSKAAAPSLACLKSWIRKVDVKVFTTNGRVIFCEICQCHFRAKKLFQLKQHLRTSKHIRNIEERETAKSNSQLRSTSRKKSKIPDPEGSMDESQSSPNAESKSCANCTCSLEEESAEIWTELSFDQENDDPNSKLQTAKSVTILEALEMIFDFRFHSDETGSSDGVNDRLILCSPCGKHLADLYKLFYGFKELCHEDSYIKNRIRFPSDARLFENTPQSPQIFQPHRREKVLKREERRRISRMKAQKKRLQLQSQLDRKTTDLKVKVERAEVEQDDVGDIDWDDHFDVPDETPVSLCETEMPVELEIPKRGRGRPRLDDTRPRRPPKQRKPRGPREHICQLCGKVAKSNWNLQLHIQGVHQGLRRYQCATCKKYYSSKSFLLNHVRATHNREANQFICSEPGCGKSFAYPAGLRVHKTIHTGETKFCCEVCQKRFRRGCDLKIHKATHTTEKPFVCEHCGCCFKTRLNLKKHSVIHDEQGRFRGKPPPTCPICSKTFLATWNLQLHIRTVHDKVTPFKCPLCVKAFSSGSNLKVHLQGFHKCARDDNNKIILPPFPVQQDEPVVNEVDSAMMTSAIPIPFKHFGPHSSSSSVIHHIPLSLPIPMPTQQHQSQSQDLRLTSEEVANQPGKTGSNGEEVWSNRSYSNVVTSYL